MVEEVASGTGVINGYVEETTRGETPGTPTLKELRGTTKNINPSKNVLTSDEARNSRQIRDERHGFNSVEGSVGAPLALADFDDIISLAMASNWAAITITGQGTDVVASSKTITVGAGDLVAEGLRPGDMVKHTGFSNSGNNGTFRVVTVPSTTTYTVDDSNGVLVDESAATATIAVPGQRIDIGTILKTMSLERQFTDLTTPLYQLFRGVGVNSMEISVTPEDLARITFGLIGLSFPALSTSSVAASAPTAPANNDALAAFDGNIFENGSPIAVATSLNFTLANNRTTEAVIGSKFSPDLFEGTAEVTGETTLFLQDATLIDKFINETETSLWLRLNDPDGVEFLNFVLPRVKFNGAAIDPPQQGPVAMSVPFRSLEDDNGTSLTIQRSNA